MLYIVTGQPAVGKTTWARKKAAELNACFIDIDIVFEPVIKAGLSLAGFDENDRDSPHYKRTFRQPVYQAMFNSAAENLNRMPVVLSGPFTQELADPGWTESLSITLDCNVIVYWLTAPPEQVKQQMIKRNNVRDKQKLDDWESYQEYFVTAVPKCTHTRIDMHK